jgi:hypothetical protein
MTTAEGRSQHQEKEVTKPARRRQQVVFPSGIPPWISSVRRRPANLFGGGKKGLRGEHLALGGGGRTRRNRPESPGDGGGSLGVAGERVEGERRETEAGLGRFDRPRSWPVGLDPAGLARLGQWAKAHLQIQFNLEKNMKLYFSFLKLIQI